VEDKLTVFRKAASPNTLEKVGPTFLAFIFASSFAVSSKVL
jgi:hypothetical protein